jgi:hypothetical protein
MTTPYTTNAYHFERSEKSLFLPQDTSRHKRCSETREIEQSDALRTPDEMTISSQP